MKKGISISFIFFLVACWSHAQEQAHYSLYMLRPTLINPAAMGSYESVNAAMLFNAQMIGFKGAPLVGSADVGVPIGKTGLSVGAVIGQDKIGAMHKSTFGASLSYRIRLHHRHYLSLGLNATAEMTQADFSTLIVQDPNDPLIQQYTQTYWNPNFRLGAYYFTQNLYVGMAVGNIISLRADSSFTPQINANIHDIHFYLQAGGQVKMGTSWKFQPSVLLKQIAGSPIQADVNIQFLFRDAWGFGASYRTLNTLIVQSNYTFKKMITIGYAFNLGLGFSDRTQYTGHEVMLAFKAPNTKMRIPVEVPRF
ncbi:MAG: PorP/SprF family type IX secretion system membrane protein [Candidatus Competibacteraceae bacterium]|nr:PorP/SprF family type IX secretion system membrane protein [Candidatus Competibacteraceae bacterium]